jgi:hypothetical protein
MADDNKDLIARIDGLLRTRECLLAAAPLVGKVAVRYRPAPPAKPPKVKPEGKPEESGEVTAKPPGPAPCPSPWHKTAVASKCSESDINGHKWLAKVTIDGALYERLDEAGKDAALVIALRGLRHRAGDNAEDKVSIERPPVRCWPDTRDEAVRVMAALGPDGAEGAALVGALSEADDLAALEEAIARITRRVDAGQDISNLAAQLREQLDALGLAVAWTDEQATPSDNEPEPIVRRREALKIEVEPDGDVQFYAVDKYGDATPSRFEIGWGHSSREQLGGNAQWSAGGWVLCEGGDLHDGKRSLREVIDDLGPFVFLTLVDYKRDRGVKIEAVIDAARTWAGLPPLAETPVPEIAGEVPEPSEEDDSEDDDGGKRHNL